ncbi:MAG: hypothetical protein PVF17_12175 [Ignavibacteria bacterium]|jgi:hypothetical protein
MGGGREAKSYPVKEPDPPPTPQVVEEQIAAKDAVKRKARKSGRESNIFARMLNSQILNFGKSKVGE